jgi:hypothetical protein
VDFTFSSPFDLVTPGRTRASSERLPSLVVASNLTRLAGALISKGLNRSLIACRAVLRCSRWWALAPDFAFWRFCFFDCWGPSTPLSRSEDLSCLSCDGGILARQALGLLEV